MLVRQCIRPDGMYDATGDIINPADYQTCHGCKSSYKHTELEVNLIKIRFIIFLIFIKTLHDFFIEK